MVTCFGGESQSAVSSKRSAQARPVAPATAWLSRRALIRVIKIAVGARGARPAWQMRAATQNKQVHSAKSAKNAKRRVQHQDHQASTKGTKSRSRCLTDSVLRAIPTAGALHAPLQLFRAIGFLGRTVAESLLFHVKHNTTSFDNFAQCSSGIAQADSASKDSCAGPCAGGKGYRPRCLPPLPKRCHRPGW